MSEIFYSQVDANLQKELNARGAAGRISRTTKDLQFMLEKIANVSVVPFREPERLTTIDEAILGGGTVRFGEFLPSGPNGFLTDRRYTVTDKSYAGNIAAATADPNRINSSRRVPPYITSCDVSIGDHSNGLLNEATINIVIPNPERDLNFIESVYFRPGRACSITIQHPETAVVSRTETLGLLTRDTLPSTEKLAELYPTIFDTGSLWEKYGKMNVVIFDGLITSFTLDYQLDMSVQATLSLTGTSNVYTDVSLIIDSKSPTAQLKQPNKQTTLTTPVGLRNPFTRPNTILSGQSRQNLNLPTYHINLQDALKEYEDAPEGTIFRSFYDLLNSEVQDHINLTQNKTASTTSNVARGYTEEFLATTEIQQGDDISAIWGNPFPGGDYQQYITLAWLIDFINRIVLPRMSKTAPNAKIICTKKNDLCVSNYYERIVSVDPIRVFFAGCVYGSLTWFGPTLEEAGIKIPQFLVKEKQIAYPTSIFINMEVIQETIKSLETAKNFTVSAFLNHIALEISIATGGAVNLNLITHPQAPDALLFYDANKTKFKETPVVPYSVPMFANHPAGTVVRDFKFSGKLPSDASNLAYVVNQDPSEISESDIAPYVAYMYTANTIERVGSDEVISNIVTPQQIQQINLNYKNTHKEFLKAFEAARVQYGLQPTNIEKQASLAQSMKKYIEFPTETIQQSNQLYAPVIPFDVEFTVDGINGFRYGDVLTFKGLPSRYQSNAVFSVVSITHTVGTDGQWTSTIRCIMRPRIN